MKTADQIVDEIVLAVMPLNGAVVLMEFPGVVPNWVVAGAIGPTQADGHASKVDALRKSDPQIDWSAISERDGDRLRTRRRSTTSCEVTVRSAKSSKRQCS